jgi:hypothetical protein
MLNALGTAGNSLNDLRDLFFANGQKGSKLQQPIVTVRKRVTINRILVEEGIDVAIWKLMSDRKWRGAKEIVVAIKDFGFDPAQVENRTASLVRSNRIYDRRGEGPRTVYRLKAHVPMPTPANEKDEAMLDAVTPEAVVEQLPVEAPVVLAEEVKAEPQKLGAILPTDTLDVAIWKLMADFGEYSAGDLAVFLADYDYNPVSISPKLSRFFKAGYVSRREVQQLPKRPYYAYRLNDMPMPFAGRQQAAPNQEAQTQNDNKEEEVNGKELVEKIAPLAVPIHAAPLFETSMKIRGMDFTFDEVKELYEELTSSGFAEGAPVKKSLIKASYDIKGISFTHEELNALVGKIASFGVVMAKLAGL